MQKILIVDDEPSVLSAFQEMLSAEGYVVSTAASAESAQSLLQSESPDIAVLDICLPGMDGLDMLQNIKRRYPMLPVIVMTGRGSMQTAIEATKRGAFDYHLKPFEPEEMLRTIEHALQGAALMGRPVAIAPETESTSGDAIVGQTPAMQVVYKAIGRVAATDATVLIRGESGTGKELVARAIYQHSRRAGRPLLVLNCAAIPEPLLESELFGHERAAFTGAAARRIGKCEQAHGGTLFLDEIGDMPIVLQSKILRFLQEKEMQRVGGDETIHSDVRVLAATNRDLEKAIRQNRFREDLYHRLNVVSVELPPLRDRRDDIPRLIHYFVHRFSAELGISPPPIASDSMELLVHHSWPGNVRELEHCIQRAVIFTRGHTIQASDVPLQSSPPEGTPDADAALLAAVKPYVDGSSGANAYDQFMQKAERALLQAAMSRVRWNQSQAARLLGLPRPTLHARLQKLGLRADDQSPRPRGTG